MSAEDSQGEGQEKEGNSLVSFLLENRTLVNFASILMIIFAVWATIEVITNVRGLTWWPPETGIPADELFNNPDKTQNINNGLIIALGAICGTLGFLIQYFYRAAPYVDASMAATAAIIIKQATSKAAEVEAKEMITKAEVAASIAADTAIRESSEDTLQQAKETAEVVAHAAVEEMMAATKADPEPVAKTSKKQEVTPSKEETVSIEEEKTPSEDSSKVKAESADDGSARKF
jgi:hypothetical protein